MDEYSDDYALKLSDQAVVRWGPDCCVSLTGSETEFSSSEEGFVMLLQAFARRRRASQVLDRFPASTRAEMVAVVEELLRARVLTSHPLTEGDNSAAGDDVSSTRRPLALGIASPHNDASVSWLQIQTATACNFRCWYCTVSHVQPRPSNVMTMECFGIVIEAISTAIARRQMPVVSFSEYNEPTLDPLFLERLSLLSARGFTYQWFSNGSNMTPDIVRFLVEERPMTTSLKFNLASLEPARLARLVGIGFGAAARALTLFMDFLALSEKFPQGIYIITHGDGGAEHVRDFERSREAVAKFPNVRVEMDSVVSRAGTMKDVGTQLDHGTANLSCGAGHMRSLYVGIEGNLYLCCYDFEQETTYGNVTREHLLPLLLGPERHLAFAHLRRSFCRFCERAVPGEGPAHV